jgi:hypothetical protein
MGREVKAEVEFAMISLGFVYHRCILNPLKRRF